jgi:RNA polymerase sigma-70 factor (ECF subfamily)
MPETNWAALRRRLLERYDEFVRRLTRRLGSPDLAREVIHEAYLRFERVGEMEPVRNLDGYIITTAVNIAKNRSTVDRRYLSASETEALIGIPDEAPDSERTVEARSDMALLQRILAELPARRRQIFEASWVDGVPYAELAARHGVHLRTIQREIAEATAYVRGRWKESLAENIARGRRDRISGLSSE